MAEGTYQVIFSGRIIDGAELDMVKRNVARVFNLDEDRVEKLFCGRRLILKKQVDQATAEKYRTTMQRAGALCDVENVPQTNPLIGKESSTVARAASTEVTPTTSAQTDPDSDVSLAEPGVILIQPAVVPEANIDTSGMDMAEAGSQLVEHEPLPEANIDTSGMDMAEAGSQLVEHEPLPEANIDTSGMDMAEAGSQLAEHEALPDAVFDTSAMLLDEPGVELVKAKEVPPANIDTSHLSTE